MDSSSFPSSSPTKVKNSTQTDLLTEDILIMIFTYLPLNSIFKFKCICKVWFSILTNPDFMTKWFHFNTINKSLPWIQVHNTFSHRKNDPLKLMYRIAYSDLNFQLGFLKSNPFGGKLHLLGSSNGLLLCKSVSSVDEMSTYYVCNPLTAKWVCIPSPPQSKGLGVTGFFCENSSSCSSRSYYKVVHIPSFEMPSKEFNIDIFSSDLGEWISCEVSCSRYIEWKVPLINNVITHNGVMYWIEGRNRILVYDLCNNTTGGGQCSLVYLPEEEFYGFIRAPHPFDTSRSQFLGESEGLICYARISRNQRTLSVWVLEEDNWQSVHEDIELQDISAKMETRMIGGAIQVLGFTPVDRNIVLLGCKNYVWGFNMQTRRSEELSYPSFSASTHSDSGDIMLLPFVLILMPTILPPPFWIDT